MDRRTYLATGAAIALSGCTELGGPGESDTDGEPSDDSTESSDDSDGSDSDDYPELVGTFDDFEDLDEWWEWQDIGFLEADASRSFDGSQSALLTSSTESDGQVRVRRELDEPIDVRDVAPGLATATDTDQGVVRIQLQDEDAHYLEYSQQIMGDMPLTPNNFGVTRIRGEPDMSEVVVLQVIRWFGGDAEGRQWIDDFHFVPKASSGKVMLQFHGGYETHYTEGLSRVSKYEFPATAFVPTDRVREDDRGERHHLTTDQLEELADAGWTIGAQPATGQQLDSVDSSRLEDVIADPIEWLNDEGYEDGARFFAYPNSQYTEESYELVRENYDLAFAGQSEAQGYAGNPHLCSVVANPGVEEAAEALERTVEWDGITNFAFYQLENENVRAGLEEVLARLDEYVAAGELDVITPDEMADEYVY
ncbi:MULTISPECIES: polysaccharide deacetylase family protein [Natrialbaceae]|uniref:polysaccharide deacetylase family protein n=1 Tax=Natrialbaceae TaxID=1644061 RepID=UPI00207CBB22|nr:polysaccharide deacetylase family protein [Natronococcus sp. CG52]